VLPEGMFNAYFCRGCLFFSPPFFGGPYGFSGNNFVNVLGNFGKDKSVLALKRRFAAVVENMPPLFTFDFFPCLFVSSVARDNSLKHLLGNK